MGVDGQSGSIRGSDRAAAAEMTGGGPDLHDLAADRRDLGTHAGCPARAREVCVAREVFVAARWPGGCRART